MVNILLKELYKTIEEQIEIVWSKKEPVGHLNSLAIALQLISAKVIQIGTKIHDEINEAEESQADQLSAFVIHYDWLKESKSFLILLRDIIFEYQKALIMIKGKKLDHSALIKLTEESKNVLTEATAEFRNYYEKKISNISISEKSKTQYIEKKNLITNPWEIYKEQIKTLSSQGNKIIEEFQKLETISDQIQNHKNIIFQIVNALAQELERIEKIGDDVINNISENLHDNPQKIIRQIDSFEKHIHTSNQVLNYTEQSDILLDNMVSKMVVPIELKQSQILYKEVYFSKSVQHWLEGQVQPILQEAQELVDNVGNSMKMSLANVKNRMTLLVNDPLEVSANNVDALEIQAPINSILEKIDEDKGHLSELKNLITLRIEEEFNILDVYNMDKEFLEGSQQYLIEQLKLEQSPWIDKFKSWIKIRWEKAKTIMANVAEEESLSDSERIVRYVQNRKSQEENYQYNNIFSSHGFMGDSFWVGRNNELNHFKQIVQNWEEGFRGSVILSGMRFCGKTVFGEVISLRYFPKNTIRLTPHSILKVNSRTLEIEDNIEVALDFIKKNTVNERHLVWIDDLELWQSPSSPLSRNIKALIANIDDMSSHIFFMVSCSNWFLYHLEQMFQIERAFQAEINLDYMKEEEVRQAISIRHGATHKVLFDEEYNRITSDGFSKRVHRVYNLAHNNIGEALNIWSSFIEKGEADGVIYKPKVDFHLPNFLNDQNRILLRAILMNKRTNEYRLRKYFGRAFRDKYHSIVQRLINLGTLNRHFDGNLEINKNLANDTARLMDQANYINCTR